MIPSYTADELKSRIVEKLERNFGQDVTDTSPQSLLKSCMLVIRDIMTVHQADDKKHDGPEGRHVHYLSLEFLLGRSLEKNAFNLGLLDSLTEAVESLGYNASDLFELEPDAGLGNGGLGRLAACYLESMTTLEIPATGYTICYELGIFKQKMINGQQVELPDNWLEIGGTWLIPKLEETEEVRFGGTVTGFWEDGHYKVRQDGYDTVLAVPRDMVIAGYHTQHTNILRLWDAKSAEPVDMSFYSRGEYLKAVERQAMAEVIAKVLYPEDHHYEGKSLRLKQQYFFVSATVQSIARKHRQTYKTMRNFHEKHIIQINDTHPSLVIPELMRILLDEDGYSWDESWEIVCHTVAYTNHTVMVEALERWPQNLMASLLPRIWEIIREISARYQDLLNMKFYGDQARVRDCAIVWDEEIRMANLCVCASFSVNGVSELHSGILRREVFHNAASLWPEKFRSVTNGIDHRRWLGQINPQLDRLVQDCGCEDYCLHPEILHRLLNYKNDTGFLHRLEEVKLKNKMRFSDYVAKQYGVLLNPEAIFDVQAKRLHEYKRQLLNAMHILSLYHQLKDNPNVSFYPQIFLFAAKAAPGYVLAKEIIQMIFSLAEMINGDPACKDRLQVCFLENYRVSLAEKLMPAADLSEQISTAGKEASGTGNMKFMMNAALTIGTMDGANIEMYQQVGGENMFLFGHTADQLQTLRLRGYQPNEFLATSPGLREVLDHMSAGFGDGKRYHDLSNRLLFGHGGQADEYFLIADYADYCEKQRQASLCYQDRKRWNQMALVNVACSGVFAADRSIREYASSIWSVPVRNTQGFVH